MAHCPGLRALCAVSKERKQALAGHDPGAKDSVCPGQQGKVKMGGFEGHFGEEPSHHVSGVK